METDAPVKMVVFIDKNNEMGFIPWAVAICQGWGSDCLVLPEAFAKLGFSPRLHLPPPAHH